MKRFPFWFYLALIWISVPLIFWHTRFLQPLDPDFFYHLRISQLFSENGLVRSIPQIIGLGWDLQFPEKEFLFHAVTGLLYRIWGEAGVSLVVYLVGTALAVFLYWVGTQRTSPFRAFLGVAVLFVCTSYFSRLAVVRPQILAMLWFSVILYALSSSRKKTGFGAGMLFSLSYHAFYLGFIPAAIGFAFSYRSDRKLRETSAFICLGLLAGVLFNPYFPEFLGLVWQQLLIGISPIHSPQLKFAGESIPIRSDQLLKQHVLPLAFVALAVFQAIFKTVSPRARLLLVNTVLFWVMTALNQRMREYAVPSTVFLSFELLNSLKFKEAAQVLFLTVAAVAQAVGTYSFYAKPRLDRGFNRDAMAALGSIPKNLGQSKVVFHCSSVLGHSIFYARPDLRFMDLLDPNLLFYRDRDLFDFREALNSGNFDDPYVALRNRLSADFVYCRDGILSRRLEYDFLFTRLFPKAEFSGDAFVYGVNSAFSALAVNRFDKEERITPSCYRRTVAASELKRLEGSLAMGVGNAHPMEIWVNGSAFYRSVPPVFWADIRRIHVFLPLERPLRATDRIEVQSCADTGQGRIGSTVSFWSTRHISAFCEERGGVRPLLKRSSSRWPYSGAESGLCEGKMPVIQGDLVRISRQ